MYEDHLNAIANAWSTGNLDQLDEYLSPDTVREAPKWMDTTANSLEELKKIITDFRVAFPDAHVTVNAVASGENISFCQWTFTGTNTGKGEFEPTGKKVTLEGASFHRYEDGKLKHETAYFDALDFFTQLGIKEMARTAAG